MNLKLNLYNFVFIIIAVCICILLSTRDIGGFYDSNDTGRYIEWIGSYCLGDTSYYAEHLDSISYKVFYTTTTIGCSITEPRVFLFLVSFYTIVPFFFFNRKGQSTFLWLLGLAFSIYSFELMTNAMRQALGLALFIFSLGFLNVSKLLSIMAVLLAVLAHSSLTIYVPFYIGLLKISFIHKIFNNRLNFFLWLLTCVIVIYLSLKSGFLYDSVSFYREIYQNALSYSFLAFISAPVIFVYLVRKKIDSAMISIEEVFCFYYSMILIVVSALIFPAITYRIIFLTFPIYIYMVCSNRTSALSGSVMCSGMMLHSFVMFYMSSS